MRKILPLFAILFLFGCAHESNVGVRTRIRSQVRIYENVPYNALFKQVLNTVRNESFRIKVSNPSNGLILATYTPADKDSLFLSALGPNYKLGRGEVIECVINLDKIQDKKTKTRLSLQRIQSYNLLGNHEGVELMDLGAYRAFYQKLTAGLSSKYPSMGVKVPLDSLKKPSPAQQTKASS